MDRDWNQYSLLLFPANIAHLFGSERRKGARDRLFEIFIPDSNLIAYLKI